MVCWKLGWSLGNQHHTCVYLHMYMYVQTDKYSSSQKQTSAPIPSERSSSRINSSCPSSTNFGVLLFRTQQLPLITPELRNSLGSIQRKHLTSTSANSHTYNNTTKDKFMNSIELRNMYLIFCTMLSQLTTYTTLP